MDTRFIRTLRLGLKSLMLHKLRSSLTALGIVFGVCSVIAMVAIGEGASHEAQERIKGLGATNIIVRSVKPVQEGTNVNRGSRVLEYGVKVEDYERIRSTIPTLKRVLPIWELTKELRHNHNFMDGRVVATTPAYQEINSLRMQRGRFLRQTDADKRENVAVLAHEVAQTLFPIEDPVGQAVSVGYDYYRVVGVCEPRSATAAVGGSLAAQEYNKDIYIPLATARLRFGELQTNFRGGNFSFESTQLSQITLSVNTTDDVERTANVIRDLISRYHPPPADYAVVVPLELLKEAEQIKLIFSVVLGAVGAISLLVGGIGIMNIMLATVTERTREIGIRRALGAKRRDITVQFLIETLVLSSVGGLLGVGLGVGLAYLVEQGGALLGIQLPTKSSLFPNTPFRWDIAVGTGALLGLLGFVMCVLRIASEGATPARILQAAGALLGGALVGVLFGIGLPYMISDVVVAFVGQKAHVPAIVNPLSLPVAFGISLAIGVFFGIYPARRAALMDPIEALRHD